MNESSHLINKKKNQLNLEEEFCYGEVSLSPKAKIALFVFGFIACPLILYLLIFFLPAKFIPEAVNLNNIQKISELNIAYEPLTKKRTDELRLNDDLAIMFDSQQEMISHEMEIEVGQNVDNRAIESKNMTERLIMVGDIHGHYKEFKKLLRKVKFNYKTDHLVMLGDFISKGPDSIKVLDYAIDNNLDCVLGNHEYSILQNYANFHRLKAPAFEMSDISEVYRQSEFNADPEYLIAKKLLPKHIAFLNKCSVIKRLGRVPVLDWKKNSRTSLTEGVAVHAGIRWDISLEEQDPTDNLEMRAYIGPYFNRTSNDDTEDNAVSWPKFYNEKQEQKEKSKEETLAVYYAHYARKGLTLRKYSKGLDSGCHNGDYLSAVIIWNEAGKTKKGKQVVYYKEKIAQVKCG